MGLLSRSSNCTGVKNEESQSDAPLVCSYTGFTVGAETFMSANELEMEL